MRKVKIVCTLGPACGNIDKIRDLVGAGLNVARFNFSHGDYASHGRMLEMLRQVESEGTMPIAAILDTKGPEIRTGELDGHRPVQLKAGAVFTLVTDECLGDADHVSVSFDRLAEEIAPGQDIFIDDGAIHLNADRVEPGRIVCRVLVGGALGERKGLNIPGADLSVPTLMEKDIK
ncbi:MAG: pyruvate kinase, partial [Synergistaceae bacterium]|nr:pyruvate kinase [Synergistaceae bacterium]